MKDHWKTIKDYDNHRKTTDYGLLSSLCLSLIQTDQVGWKQRQMDQNARKVLLFNQKSILEGL